MRIVAQRVSHASVSVDGTPVGAIGPGLAILLGVERNDDNADAEYLAAKCAGLRVFEDRQGKMNLSLIDVGGEALVVSQFTLLGDVRKGKRPSFGHAAPPEQAARLYRHFVACLRRTGLKVATGEFQAMMRVSLVNEGPVTILLDSKRVF